MRQLGYQGPVWLIRNARRPERFVAIDRESEAVRLRREIGIAEDVPLLGFVGKSEPREAARADARRARTGPRAWSNGASGGRRRWPASSHVRERSSGSRARRARELAGASSGRRAVARRRRPPAHHQRRRRNPGRRDRSADGRVPGRDVPHRRGPRSGRRRPHGRRGGSARHGPDDRARPTPARLSRQPAAARQRGTAACGRFSTAGWPTNTRIA